MKMCKTLDCPRPPHNHESWDGGEYCKECFRRIEEGVDAMRDEVRLNRSLGYNDDGSMTRFVNGIPNGDPNASGDIEYGRRDTWLR